MYQFALSPSTEVGICSRGPCASSPRITINHDACFLQAAQNRSPVFAFQVHSNMNTSGYICMPLTQGVLYPEKMHSCAIKVFYFHCAPLNVKNNPQHKLSAPISSSCLQLRIFPYLYI